jgi:hypothetical protein
MTRRAANLRSAGWALVALTLTRRRLRRRGIEHTAVPSPPTLPASAILGVEAALRGARASCLERALVRQRWLADHGRPLDLVIGVGRPDGRFGAHAWLEGEEDPLAHEYQELKRLAVS